VVSSVFSAIKHVGLNLGESCLLVFRTDWLFLLHADLKIQRRQCGFCGWFRLYSRYFCQPSKRI